MKKQNVVLTSGDVYRSRPVYSRLNHSNIQSATYALYFSLNAAELDKHYSEIEAKRVELIKRYGKEDKDAGTTTVPDENIEDFNVEFVELMRSELNIDLYLFSPESLDIMFRKVSGELVDDLTPDQIMSILYMIKVENND